MFKAIVIHFLMLFLKLYSTNAEVKLVHDMHIAVKPMMAVTG